MCSRIIASKSIKDVLVTIRKHRFLVNDRFLPTLRDPLRWILHHCTSPPHELDADPILLGTCVHANDCSLVLKQMIYSIRGINMVSLDHLKGKSRDMTTVYNMESLQESIEAVSVPRFAIVLTR